MQFTVVEEDLQEVNDLEEIARSSLNWERRLAARER